MKLWLLTAIETDGGPWDPWYDKAFGMAVLAEDESHARLLAADECGDEGTRAWLNAKHSTCVELLTEGDARVVLVDFRSA